MKRKILSTLTIIIIILSLVFAFVGCNKKPKPLENPIKVPDLLDGAKIVKSSSEKSNGLIDNTKKVWKSEKYNKKGFSEFVEIDFGKPVVFNTAILEEVGDNIRLFRLQKLVDENWVDFYRSDKIQDYRMCTFTAVETQFVRIVIEDAVGIFSIKEMSIYNLPKKELDTPFRVSAYVRFDGDNPREVRAKGENYAKVYSEYYEVITDVILFVTTGWDENGKIQFYKNGELPKNETEEKEFEENFAADLAAFRQILNMRENKTPINITATFFNPGKQTAKSLRDNMNVVVDNIYNTVIKYDLDGIDIDWEYPENDEEWQLYDTFINKINDKFDSYLNVKDLLYSSALSTWGNHFKQSTIDRIDQLNYMGYDAYDGDGWQSTFKVTAVDAMAYFVNLGFKPSQINLGVPAFARPTSGTGHWPTWRDYDFGADGYWQNYYKNLTYYNLIGSVHFNSPGMVSDKTAYSLNIGLGGVMIFRLACDKLMDDPNCLVKAIGKTINERSVVKG